ncbi:GIY-YIG nuclease family protein [Patescibacteria group bacterium]
MQRPPNFSQIPTQPGVYLFKKNRGEVLYVGKSVNLKSRLGFYFRPSSDLGPRTRLMVKRSQILDFILVDCEIEALLLEAKLIRKYQPEFNVRCRDDKSPLYIKISHEEFPRVKMARKKDCLKSDRIFGPFPSSQTVKRVLKILRKIFPYCTCSDNRGKPCLYAQLKLCCPSPRAIIKLPPLERKKKKRIYQQNIRFLIRFLEGKKNKVILKLERKMIQQSQLENFEAAEMTKQQISNLQYIQSRYRLPNHYLNNPNLLADLRFEEMSKLQKTLKKAHLPLKKLPRRIEAYDISNLQGQKATGSMVTFVNGEPERNFYRRFKISKKGDDSLMMAEVIKRRLRHRDWPLPQLILLDGGKPQLSAVLALFSQNQFPVPILGLAKKHEDLIFKDKEKFVRVKVPLNSPALHILQRIRNEAHRFALKYHHHLRYRVLKGKD